MTERKSGYIGNTNAKKLASQLRKPVLIRLPEDILEKLRSSGNITQQIEDALRKQFGW